MLRRGHDLRRSFAARLDPASDDARHGQDRRQLTRSHTSAASSRALAVVPAPRAVPARLAWLARLAQRSLLPLLPRLRLVLLLPLLPLLLLLPLSTGCASSAPAAAGDGSGGGRPAYTAPIQQITLRGGRLGWGGFEIGMSFGEVQSAAGRHLASLGLEPRDPLCGFTMVEVAPHHQPLQLEFDPTAGDTGRVKAIWLLLPDRKGAATTAGMVRALKARFPDLTYLHSSHDPTLAESTNERPFFRGAGGAIFFVDPRLGIYFGDVCFE
jgi:hypothetical protein